LRSSETLARMHLKPMKFKREDAEADPLIAIAGGGGIKPVSIRWATPGPPTTSRSPGELDVDLRKVTSRQRARAKIVYERLINFLQ